MTTTTAVIKAYKVLGTTGDVTTCDLCGKPELKGTVVLAALDADGNPEDVSYFGTACAATATGWTQRDIRAGITTAKAEQRERQAAERAAREEAENAFLAAWYLEHHGTPDLHEAAKRAGMSPARLSDLAITAYQAAAPANA